MGREEADWLGSLRRDLVGISEGTAGQLWPSPREDAPAFFNYRVEHVRQVERDALLLLKEVGGDSDIVLASVWLHDRFQPAFNVAGHNDEAAEWAAENLAARGFPSKKVDAVCFAVASHCGPPHSLPTEAHEARVLWDADKLAHIGPHEVLTVLFNSIASDSLEALRDDPLFPEDRLTINDLAVSRLRRYATRSSPADKFYFDPTRKWAHLRHEAQRLFCEVLCAQVHVAG